MIVNRSHAEEARATLGAYYDAPPVSVGWPELDAIRAEDLKRIYRIAAAATHPDREGGNVEAFTAVDRAKCILELWLARQPADVPKGLVPTACVRCRGVGRMRVNKGFNSYVVRCNTCNGTGDGSYDHDRSKE